MERAKSRKRVVPLKFPPREGGRPGVAVTYPRESPETGPIARFPASLFAIGLSMTSFAGPWLMAEQLWGTPGFAVAIVVATAGCLWAVLIGFYILKFWLAPQAARAELADPVQSCFPGLAGTGLMLLAVDLLPYSATAASILLWLGGIFAVGFGLWRSRLIWLGPPAFAEATPALYLPVAAASFVLGVALASFGQPAWGQLALGAGLFSWLTLDSVMFHRLYLGEPLREQVRPTLGVQLAPPAVCSLSYVAVSGTRGDVFAYVLIGYAILQAFILAVLLPRMIRRFTVGLWSLGFGATALATTIERLAVRGDTGPMATLALPAFIAANLVIFWLIGGTLIAAASGRLLPPAAANSGPDRKPVREVRVEAQGADTAEASGSLPGQ